MTPADRTPTWEEQCKATIPQMVRSEKAGGVYTTLANCIKFAGHDGPHETSAAYGGVKWER